MAHVPVRRMQEMEEEMNRFEEEILNTMEDGGRRFQQPPPMTHGPPMGHPSPMGHPIHQGSMNHGPPMNQVQMNQGPMGHHPIVPPPPPPPSLGVQVRPPFNMIPSFIPPQLRARQMMLPPRPPPMLLRAPMPPPIPNGFQPAQAPPPMMNRVPPPNSFNFSSSNKLEEAQYHPKITTPSVISAAKVVYSAPPVKNVTDKKSTDVTKQATSSSASTSASSTTSTNASVVSASATNDVTIKTEPGVSKKKENDDLIGPSAKMIKLESLVKAPINSNSKITVNLQSKNIDGTKKSTTSSTTMTSSSSSSSSSTSRSTTKATTTTAPNLTSTKQNTATSNLTSTSSTPASSSVAAATKPSSSSASSSGAKDKKDKKEKKRKYIRMAAGNVWEDVSLNEWDPDDFRLFCGDLGNEVTDDVLNRVFSKYPSFQKARVIRDKRTNKTKGFGFASFKDPTDFMKAIRDLNGKYVGNRPIKLKKSCWQDRQYENMKKREREKKRLGFR